MSESVGAKDPGASGASGASGAAGAAGASSQPVVRVSAVYRTFEAELAPVRALRGASLEMASGEFVAIMGPSGCGKSTLLNLVAGLDRPDEGSVEVAGISLVGLDESQLAIMRRSHVGIVCSSFFNLFETMTALENVLMPALLGGTRRRVAESRARDLLDLLGYRRQGRAVADGVVGWAAAAIGDCALRSRTSRPCCSPMSRRARSTPTAGTRSWSSSAGCTRGGQTILLVTHDQPVGRCRPAHRAHARRAGRRFGKPRRSPRDGSGRRGGVTCRL